MWNITKFQVRPKYLETNVTDFTALPGVQRTEYGKFLSFEEISAWLTSTEVNINYKAFYESKNKNNASIIILKDNFSMCNVF